MKILTAAVQKHLYFPFGKHVSLHKLDTWDMIEDLEGFPFSDNEHVANHFKNTVYKLFTNELYGNSGILAVYKNKYVKMPW